MAESGRWQRVADGREWQNAKSSRWQRLVDVLRVDPSDFSQMEELGQIVRSIAPPAAAGLDFFCNNSVKQLL